MNAIVGEAQHSIAELFELQLALPVLRSLLYVNTAIKFNEQARLIATEVRDTRRTGNRMLASKLKSARPAVAQSLPQEFLGRSLSFAQIARQFANRFTGQLVLAANVGRVFCLHAIVSFCVGATLTLKPLPRRSRREPLPVYDGSPSGKGL